VTTEPVVSRVTFCREAFKTARVLPTYPLQLTLDERRHRMLVLWESIEALKLARDAYRRCLP
jgi:hypothetical protein